MGDPNRLSEIDTVNPYIPVRWWLYNQLNNLLPSNTMEINSLQHGALFEKWTGSTHASLKATWAREKIVKDANNGKGPTTTTCNAFLGTVVNNVRISGKLPIKGFQSFNLQVEKGWHWYPDAVYEPQAGDFFQYGQKVNPTNPDHKNNWYFKHVGIILEIFGGNWITMESGQGGPTTGYDIIRRKGPRPFDTAGFMGFINIEELFEGWNGPVTY